MLGTPYTSVRAVSSRCQSRTHRGEGLGCNGCTSFESHHAPCSRADPPLLHLGASTNSPDVNSDWTFRFATCSGVLQLGTGTVDQDSVHGLPEILWRERCRCLPQTASPQTLKRYASTRRLLNALLTDVALVFCGSAATRQTSP